MWIVGTDIRGDEDEEEGRRRRMLGDSGRSGKVGGSLRAGELGGSVGGASWSGGPDASERGERKEGEGGLCCASWVGELDAFRRIQRCGAKGERKEIGLARMDGMVAFRGTSESGVRMYGQLEH